MTATDTSTDIDDFGSDFDLDWATDDNEPLACGIENPDDCEACQ